MYIRGDVDHTPPHPARLYVRTHLVPEWKSASQGIRRRRQAVLRDGAGAVQGRAPVPVMLKPGLAKGPCALLLNRPSAPRCHHGSDPPALAAAKPWPCTGAAGRQTPSVPPSLRCRCHRAAAPSRRHLHWGPPEKKEAAARTITS